MNGRATTRVVFKAYVFFFLFEKKNEKEMVKYFFPDQLLSKARPRNEKAIFRYYFILLSSELLKKT